MSLICKFLDKIRRKPIKINSPWGQTTEAARLQAARNIHDSPEIREQVLAMLEAQYGSREAAERELRRRYPEAG